MLVQMLSIYYCMILVGEVGLFCQGAAVWPHTYPAYCVLLPLPGSVSLLCHLHHCILNCQTLILQTCTTSASYNLLASICGSEWHICTDL